MSVFARLNCSDISYFPLFFYLFFLITFAFVTVFIWPVIPACAGMTDIENGEISYCPHFCSSSSRTRGPILKRANVFELIKPTKSVCSALAEAWIPACAGMTDIESCEISYRPHFCSSSSQTRGPILKRKDVFESIKPTKNVRSALAEAWIPACAGMTDIESNEISYSPRF
ncbi:hypothetical protein ACI1IY_002346, partial [Vibrio vulnificus]